MGCTARHGNKQGELVLGRCKRCGEVVQVVGGPEVQVIEGVGSDGNCRQCGRVS